MEFGCCGSPKLARGDIALEGMPPMAPIAIMLPTLPSGDPTPGIPGRIELLDMGGR